MAKTNFAKLLDTAGISQRQFSRDTGVNLPTVNQLYNDKLDMVHFRTLGRICKHLSVGVEDVIEAEWLPD